MARELRSRELPPFSLYYSSHTTVKCSCPQASDLIIPLPPKHVLSVPSHHTVHTVYRSHLTYHHSSSTWHLNVLDLNAHQRQVSYALHLFLSTYFQALLLCSSAALSHDAGWVWCSHNLPFALSPMTHILSYKYNFLLLFCVGLTTCFFVLLSCLLLDHFLYSTCFLTPTY